MTESNGGERRNNRGALFQNDRKRAELDPDCKGSITIEGREYWLSGWRKTSPTGLAFLCLTLRWLSKKCNVALEKKFDQVTAVADTP
jgi:hypothetical protein